MRADGELDIGRKTFVSGLLLELVATLRRCAECYAPALAVRTNTSGRAVSVSFPKYSR